MRIVFERVTTDGGLRDHSLILDIHGVTLLKTNDNELGKAILNAIIGLDEVISGNLTIDGIPLEEYLGVTQLPQAIGYVFDEGIMLSNLTLRENLLLPYRMIADDTADDNFNQEIGEWMRRFELNIDLDKRPDFVKPSDLKVLSFIRPLLFSPKLLLVDDPYYLLSQTQRKAVLRVLCELKADHLMLILSLDEDFVHGFGAEIVELPGE